MRSFIIALLIATAIPAYSQIVDSSSVEQDQYEYEKYSHYAGLSFSLLSGAGICYRYYIFDHLSFRASASGGFANWLSGGIELRLNIVNTRYINPYVMIGAGYYKYRNSVRNIFSSLTTHYDNELSIYGGGIGVEFNFGNRFSLNLEVGTGNYKLKETKLNNNRYDRIRTRTEKDRSITVGMGIGYRF